MTGSPSKYCKKFVLYNTCIVCQNCDHFVHRKCTNLTHEEIKTIENNNTPWNCLKCTEEIFPFFNSVNITKVLNPMVSLTASNANPSTKSKSETIRDNYLFCYTIHKKNYINHYIETNNIIKIFDV